MAKEQGIDLGADLDGKLEKIHFDPELIHRCLLNLVTNAIDACRTEHSKHEIKKVCVRSRKKHEWGVEYRVVDNGSGMADEIKNKIFQRFFSTKGSAGTGIGLMATKKIVEAHKGKITVQSEENKGSEFIIRIPPGLKIED
jgi:signal transduction histidine kinase